MIDPQKFGEELAAIVKAATAPLIARIDQLQEEAERNAARVSDLEKALQRVEPGPQGDPGPPGKDGEKGADGVGLAGALINSAGHLVLTLTNGEMKDLGPVVGKDGKDGQNGKDGERGADGVGLAGAMIDRDGRLVLTLSNGEAKELGPVVGKDGERGKDGAEGLGFEDLSFVEDEAGRPVAKFQRGDIVKSVTLPCIIDRGIYSGKASYLRGDAVTYGGSLYIAQKDAPEGTPCDGNGEFWRLAVKKGRDGRDHEAKKVL